VGAFERGRLSAQGLAELERSACPGPGTCAGHFTANTMAVAVEALGLGVLGDALIPADDAAGRAAASARAGALAAELGRHEDAPTARAFLDRRALLNAMAAIAATGGSTNGLLHLLAIAREARVELALDELTAVAARTPVIASLAPSGRHMAEDLHRVGGTPAVLAELVRAGCVDGDAPAVQGGTLAAACGHAPAPDGDVVFAADEPFKPSGALYTLRGNLAPEGSVVKLAGTGRTRQVGPARVFDSEEACTDAVREGLAQPGDVLVVRYEGPAGGPGMREMLSVTSSVVGADLGESVALVTDGRFSGRHPRLHGRPRRARGGARRPAGRRARRRPRHDRPRHGDARRGPLGRGARRADGRVDGARAAHGPRRVRAVPRVRGVRLGGRGPAPRIPSRARQEARR
jgi:dihydroxy-acid dehydratase